MQTGTSLSAIITTIIFGALTIGGMVWGIIHYSIHGREDLHSFPISLERHAATHTGSFALAGGEAVSVWLLTNSRLLELKDVSVAVAIADATGRPVADMGQDFRKMTLRNRYGDHVYYWLGDFTPAVDGAFQLSYQRGGDWSESAPPGSLVIRRNVPVSIPWAAAAMLLVGVCGLVIGIRMLIAVAARK